MRILAISDLHGSIETFEHILDQNGSVDVVILPGDITHFGPAKVIESLLEIARGKGVPLLGVAGNCDTQEVDEELLRLGIGLNGRAQHLSGIGFHGVSATPPWQSRMFHYTEEDMAEILLTGYRGLNECQSCVLVCHVPPFQTKVDRAFFGRHVGSRSVRDFIMQYQPDLVLCGHIHEARGTDRLGDSLIVNCGFGAKGYYAIVDLTPEKPPEVILGQLGR